MPMPQWAPMALAAQLLLTLFAPAVAVGERSVFFSDLWCMAWVAAALWTGRYHLKSLIPYLLATGAIIAISYAHGAFRGTLLNMPRQEKLLLIEGDTFAPVREFVIATRFLSWLWGGAIVYSWFSKGGQRAKRTFGFLCGILSASLLAELVILVLEHANPAFNQAMSKLYGFSLEAVQWRGRGNGTFRSPLEAGTAMVFGGLVLSLRAPWNKMGRKMVFWDGLLAALGGILFTRTGTAAMGLVAVALLLAVARLKNPWRWLVPLAAVVVLTATTMHLISRPGVIENKWANMLSRVVPWQIFFEYMKGRADLFLLGLGFGPYHADNSYVFIFTRGGLVALGAFLWFGGKAVANRWAIWAWSERALIVYLLVSALTLDVFIYRPIAALLLAVGIPALAGRYKLT